MKFKTILPLAGAILVGAAATFAVAGGHSPVEQREAAMKTFGASMGTIGKMAKGETPFDAAQANEALAAMKTAASGIGELFPEGTEMAGEDKWKAAPAIWTDRAGFDAQVAAINAAIDSAIAAAPQEQAALGPLVGAIGQACSSCHEKYRIVQE